jgi:hypothetical protein
LLEDAPRFLEEMVETFVVAVHGLTSAFHGTLDVLHREQSRAAPIRGLRLFVWHDRELPRCLARPSQWSATVYPSTRGVRRGV